MNCRARRVGHLVRQCRPVAVRHLQLHPWPAPAVPAGLAPRRFPADPAAKRTGWRPGQSSQADAARPGDQGSLWRLLARLAVSAQLDPGVRPRAPGRSWLAACRARPPPDQRESGPASRAWSTPAGVLQPPDRIPEIIGHSMPRAGRSAPWIRPQHKPPI